MFQRLANLTIRWPRAVVAAGVIIVGLAVYYAAGVGNTLTTVNGFIVPGSESDRVATTLAKTFKNIDTSGIVIFTAKQNGSATSVAFRTEVNQLLQPLRDAGDTVISDTGSPATSQLVSLDGHSSYAAITASGSLEAQYAALNEWYRGQTSQLVTLQLGGPAVAQHQSQTQVENDLRRAEFISFPILLLLLLVIFRGVVAALLPLLLGVVVIIGGLAITRLLSHVTNIDQYALNIITILGLGLSVDYSLLMVSRFREELHALPPGGDVRQAVGRTVLTAGRTIFFSGLTVIVSLLTLLVFPIDFLHSIGIGAAAAIVMAMVSALTILPAVLHLLGPRVDKWRLIRAKPRPAGAVSAWHRLARFTVTKPWWAIIGSVIVITALAYPVTQTRFVTQTYRFLPTHSSSRAVAQALVTNFPAQGSKIDVIVNLGQAATSARSTSELGAITQQLTAISGVARVDPAGLAGQTAALQVTARSTDDAIVRDIVTDIRSLHPASATLEVGGLAATLNDTLHGLYTHLPLAGAIIVIAMFALIGTLVRSFIIPLQAIVINSFALLAAMGVLVLVFQQAHIGPLAWLSPTAGLDPTIPVLILAIAFGLSMDYSAFLFSRMSEEHSRTSNTTAAITTSLEHTGGIITAAALLFVVVVGAFASSGSAYIEQIGLGLSVGILVDAFIVRLFLVPAIMQQFGEINWLAPAWLRRWPIRHE